ncbi:hypothetical protein BMS3Abin16_01276 [archaeon BMS3Abin16]|nr:hypothetical protein BMS3Abin16_01276 [archaeon BMS3Abin16]
MLVVGDLKDFLDEDYDKLEKRINRTTGILVKDLKVKDLIFDGDTVIDPNTGVYILSKKGKVQYVGKCGSKSFQERVPAHFDIRSDAWFGAYIGHIALMEKHGRNKYNKIRNKGVEKKKLTTEEMVSACKVALNSNLKLVKAKNEAKGGGCDYPSKLEKLLRVMLRPEFNSCKAGGTADKEVQSIKSSSKLGDILKKI